MIALTPEKLKNKITFKTNVKKAAEVLLWICDRNGGSICDYNLYAVSYFAEIEHINKHGRPIIGDTYRVYEDYIHADALYDLTWSDKLVHNVQKKTDDYPNPRDQSGILICVLGSGTRLLSKSDLVCLHWAFEKCGQLRQYLLSNLIHRDTAWKETATGNPCHTVIPWELLIKDEALKEDLSENSNEMVI